jgi:hypothetical protein
MSEFLDLLCYCVKLCHLSEPVVPHLRNGHDLEHLTCHCTAGTKPNENLGMRALGKILNNMRCTHGCGLVSQN